MAAPRRHPRVQGDVVTARVPQRCLDRVGFGHLRYRVVGYAATPGMQEAGDETNFRWVSLKFTWA